MFTLRVGQANQYLKLEGHEDISVTFDNEMLDFYSKAGNEKPTLRAKAHVNINIYGESWALRPQKMNASITLTIDDARDLAEQLLKNAREAELYITEIGQDG
jgi:hypothetical protein